MRAVRLSDQHVVSILVIADAIAVLLAYAAAFGVRARLPVPLTSALLPAPYRFAWHSVLPFAFATELPLLYVSGLYDLRLVRRGWPLVAPVAMALGTQLLAISTWCFFRGDLLFPRSVLLLFSVANLGLVVAVRVVLGRVLASCARPARIVLVGPAREVDDFAGTIRAADPEASRFRVVASVPLEAMAPGSVAAGLLRLGADLGAVDRVILVAAQSWKDDLLGDMLRDRLGGARPRVAVVPSVYDLLVGRIASFAIEDIPLIDLTKEPRDEIGFAIKAVLDYVLATLLLAATVPVVAVAALAIRFTSPGAVLYRQRRVGRGGHEFAVYKLRTMHDDAERECGPVLAAVGDARTTPVGRVLRALRIDEIPQLLNVLNGTMSLIGPRPERPELTERFERDIPGYAERWAVKPGLSGLAQVRGEYATPAAYKLKYDLAYIHNHSLLLDVRIMAETVKLLVTRRGA
jgi:exopolysaccharide biosynthesis polyprenyl glycosylphosphotransferase